MKNLSKFIIFLFLFLTFTSFILLIRTVRAQSPSNLFNCEWTGIDCVVGNSSCAPGFGPNNQTCESITDIGQCRTTINQPCISTTPPGKKYSCYVSLGSCQVDPDGTYETYAACQNACSGQVPTKFKCQDNQCVESQDGTHSTPDCDGECTNGWNDNPIPPPRIPCDPTSVDDPEFHSLRPYQASPCDGDGKMAYFCGNEIVIKEDFDKSKVIDATESCEPTFDPNYKNVDPDGSDKDYWIDISETEFPIAGNTEQVQNSQNPNDQFDDATKVNEYASWYLNGVINRAEYGDTKNTDNELVNFSGPIQKLMPSIILEAQRIGTINLINNQTDPQTEEEDKSDQEGTALNHNQIVVCAKEEGFGWFGNLLDIGKTVPVECYQESGDKYRLGDDKKLLSKNRSWEGDLSIWNSFSNTIIDLISGLLPNVARNVIEDSVGNHWNKRIPPLPWADEDGKPFEKDVLYRKAYNEWKGKTCVLIPAFDFLICFENIFVPNKYADLFPYIPLSTTADKNKKMPIPTITIQPTGGTMISGQRWNDYDGKGAPVFYFPHTGEVATLSAFLNKTYIPKDIPVGSIDLKTTESNTMNPDECRTVQVRSNEGDNLFPIKKPGDIMVTVYFEVHEIPLVAERHFTNNQGEDKIECKYSGSVTIGIHTNPVKVPFGEETWESTVAGPTSTVRRIFPKVEEGAPIECIADIPSETKAVYTPVQGTDKIGVFSLQNPQQKFEPTDARIYFPHWGSIYDYFLKGIQTAIRPKGYGEKIVSGTLCENQEEEEKMCPVDVPDSEVDSKFLGSFKANFIDLANRWTSTCSGSENNLADECYNYVASEAKKAGVNPAFALTIWLNESGASNYCFGGDTTQDLGINLSDLYQDIVGQVEAFLNMAKTKLCDGVSGFVEPMHGWLSRFQSSAGICDPNDQTATDYYYSVMNETWSFLTSCVQNGKFGITWPTDLSCP